MSDPLSRITIDPEQCGGRPCIRGLRICVTDVLELLAAGETPQGILAQCPSLQAEDVPACLLYAARRLDHPTIAASEPGPVEVWVDAQLPPSLAA